MKSFHIPLTLMLFCLMAAGCGGTTSIKPHATLDQQDAAGSSELVAQPVSDKKDAAIRLEKAPSAGSGGAYGTSYGVRPEYQTCMTNQPQDVGTAGHRQDCADEELEFQDSRLDRVYGRAMDALKKKNDEGAASARLRDSQSQWWSQTEKNCGEIAQTTGSMMGPAAQSTCTMELTARRASQLERQYPTREVK